MALFSERSEHCIVSKNSPEVMRLTSKVVPVRGNLRFGTTFEESLTTLGLFFDAVQCSDRSENSAIRSALKN